MKLMYTIICCALLHWWSCSAPQSVEKETIASEHDMPKDSMKQASKECSKFYLFQNTYIDLDENAAAVIGGLPGPDFRACSKFAHRFINPLNDSLTVNGSLFVLENNRDKRIYRLHLYKNKTLIKTIDLPVEKPLPEVHQYSFYLLPYKNEVILLMEDMYTTHYRICKYNSDGKELLRKALEHTFVTHPEPNTDEHQRYLYFADVTASQLIFSSHISFSKRSKTVVLSMDDFTMTEYDQTVHGLILDEKDEKLVGFISEDEGHFSVRVLNRKTYEFDIKYGSAGCEVILNDNLLYIANYHPIATGSSLQCFDLQSGKMKWTADVLQVYASHSQYRNKVTLSMYKNKLIMQGDESYGSYLQIFDAASGKRLAHFGNVSEKALDEK